MSRPKPNIIKALKTNIPIGSKLLVCVSGGIDSVVLLDSLNVIKQKHNLQIEVAHVDHNLRKTSNLDAKFVEKLADKHGNLFHLHNAKKSPLSKQNLESWGREVRYKYFEKIKQKQKLDWILTAHNANDQVETFFIKLLSNKEILPITKCDMERNIIRPIIEIPRSMIEEYLLDNKLEFREDESNQDTKFLRNRIRINLLPFLSQEFGVRIFESLSDRIGEIYEDSLTLKQLGTIHALKKELESLEFGGREWLRTIKEKLPKMEKNLHWRIIQEVFSIVLGYNLGRDKCKEAVNFLLSNSAQLELPNKTKVMRQKGKVVICFTAT